MIKSIYGPWPEKRFGLPWSPTSLSAKEASSYKKHFAKFDSIAIPKDGVEALRKAAETHKENLIILSIGFPTNIAAAMDTIKANKVNRIVVMGGWFEENGEIKRAGYNTVVDLAASKQILQQKDVPVIIVNSEFCKKFAIMKKEYAELQEKGTKVGTKLK